MVLAVADILEEAAHADPAPVRRANGGGSSRLRLGPITIAGIRKEAEADIACNWPITANS
jgi:hypothetical protein